jgi:hypothetical protein
MNDQTAEDIRRHFNVVGESLRSEIRAVAEGLAGFRESTSVEFSAVRAEIADTRELIRAAFADLDRRNSHVGGGLAPPSS